MKLSTISVLFAAFFLGGCVSLSPLPTPSGNPEVTISTTDVNGVKRRLIAGLAASGYSLTQDTPYLMSFSKQMEGAQGALYQAALGNSYSSTPEIHVTANFAPTFNATRVFIHVASTMQNAFGQNSGVNLDHGRAGHEFQAVLEQVKTEIEVNSGRGGQTKNGKKSKYPYGIPVPGRKGFIYSAFCMNIMDVRGFPSGTEIKCPYTGRVMLVP